MVKAKGRAQSAKSKGQGAKRERQSAKGKGRENRKSSDVAIFSFSPYKEEAKERLRPAIRILDLCEQG